jgi:hypothetical protein
LLCPDMESRAQTYFQRYFRASCGEPARPAICRSWLPPTRSGPPKVISVALSLDLKRRLARHEQLSGLKFSSSSLPAAHGVFPVDRACWECSGNRVRRHESQPSLAATALPNKGINKTSYIGFTRLSLSLSTHVSTEDGKDTSDIKDITALG